MHSSTKHGVEAADQNHSLDMVLVDDDKLTLEIVEWILRDTDITYKLFTDHVLAAAYLAEVTPRILIVDYFMPAMNGIEFLVELKKSQDLCQTRVFLCSAIAPRQSEQKTTKALKVEMLEKQVICDKPSLHRLLDMPSADNKELLK